MRRSRGPAYALVLALLAGATTGCGGDPQEGYCAAVEEHQEQLTEIAASSDTGSLFDALPVYEDLAAEAPDDIAGEWTEVVEPLRGLRDALDEAGVDPSAYDAEDPPEDVAPADRSTIEEAARRLGSEQTVTAMSGIEQHALDVCGTPLSR